MKMNMTSGMSLSMPRRREIYSARAVDRKLFDYNFSYGYTNYLPFIWSGFNIDVACTYVIDKLSDPEEVYRNFQYDMKYTIREVKKAE